jgi:Na+-transporting NADH:ubiquinone oxidoreductase subunit A
MTFLRSGAGLMPDFATPTATSDAGHIVTEEAALQPPAGPALHVTPLVKEGEAVAKGAALGCLRHAPDVCFVAPIPGRVARITLSAGRTLSEIVLYREPGVDDLRHEATQADSVAGLRRLLQTAGVWPLIGRRPFGGMPPPGEVPAGIAVMAVDTRPHAPDPLEALIGREDAFARGLEALARLTEGDVLLCLPKGAPVPDLGGTDTRTRIVRCGRRHPQGSAGLRIHQDMPASLDRPVWDIHAEDVAEIGTLLLTGMLPQERRVHIAGPALRETRTLCTHPGADLRQLTRRIALPGPHSLISGSPLDGRNARWLGQRHRQITVQPQAETQGRRHWLRAALTESRGAGPIIPTAALTQAFGAALPAAPFVRAVASGDEETATRLGLLSLLPEDVALADYVLGAGGAFMDQVGTLLGRVRSEDAP